jgi:putative tryptophan/tyrosine transport system substrate-binding protein
MKRREVVTGLVGSLAFPRGLAAQPTERTHRPGVLSPGLSSYDTLRGQLAKLGFIEGRNLVVDVRVGAPDQLPRMADELAATKPDVVMAVSAAVAAKSLPPWRERNRRGHLGSGTR